MKEHYIEVVVDDKVVGITCHTWNVIKDIGLHFYIGKEPIAVFNQWKYFTISREKDKP